MDAKEINPSKLGNKSVSIHAPVMDAKDRTRFFDTVDGFNPRARDGREPLCYKVLIR